MNIPNLISLFRLLLTPLVIWLVISGQEALAFATFLVAGVSDAADGFLAKRFGWQTELGSYLDPVADKLLLASTFVTLGLRGDVPAWLVILVVSRDALILIAIALSQLLARPVVVRPLMVSKANTAAQIVLALSALANAGFGYDLRPLVGALVVVTAALTVVSGFAYLRGWLEHMAGNSARQ